LAEAGAEAGGGNPLSPALTLILPIAVLYYFLVLRPQRQNDKSRKGLLEGLKKNDRVVTIGGIYGVVVNVQRDEDEVVLKVDENTNTKLRVTFASIARVLGDTESADKTAKT
jgi:preprotein translocase subunit YajC